MSLVDWALYEPGWDALLARLQTTCETYRDRAADCEPTDYPMRRGEYRAAVCCRRLVTEFRQACLREREAV